MNDIVKNLMLEKKAVIVPIPIASDPITGEAIAEGVKNKINTLVDNTKNWVIPYGKSVAKSFYNDVGKTVDNILPPVKSNAIVNPEAVKAVENLGKNYSDSVRAGEAVAKTVLDNNNEKAEIMASKMAPVEATQTAPTLTQLMHDNAELAGAGIGGLAGAGLGAYLGGKNNRGLGAAIGGLGGATVGGVAGHLLKNASVYAPTLTAKYASDSSIARRELPKQNKMDIVYYPDVGKHALVAGALAGVGNFSPTTGIGTGLGVYAGGKLGRGAGAVLGFPNVGAVLGETLGGAVGYYTGHKLAE